MGSMTMGKYYYNLWSPETYEVFSRSDRTVSGFPLRQQKIAQRVMPGDTFICYVTKVSRFVGILEVASPAYVDETPLYSQTNEKYVVRFRIKPLVWLEKEHGIPIREEIIWNHLTFTKDLAKTSTVWTGRLRQSLNEVESADAALLTKALLEQKEQKRIFSMSDRDKALFELHQARTDGKVISVSVPEKTDDEEPVSVPTVRESHKIQALLCQIGESMGMKIWLPRGDRANVLKAWNAKNEVLLEELPLSYDGTTIKTIEQIDVLWMKGRSIVRAFEVEHTTAVYSGILRMADLLALVPNLDIRLHIVAPEDRRDKVLEQIKRPVFSLLDKPLRETCTFIGYGDVEEISRLEHLPRISHEVLDDYAEEA
ncbi:MAG: EVE domain-containing protein [Leptospirales bacterium]|nr:EVE domain-containing protein [Leptospirales bacterium]